MSKVRLFVLSGYAAINTYIWYVAINSTSFYKNFLMFSAALISLVSIITIDKFIKKTKS